MGCCGRPNNRASKGGATPVALRYAFLSSHQRSQLVAAAGSKCITCDALTMSDDEGICTTCGVKKTGASGEG